MATPTTTTRTLRSITIPAGDRFVLPNGAKVDSVISTNGATATSECSLPPTTDYACGQFLLILDYDTENSHSMDEQNTRIMSVNVGGVRYGINEKIIPSGERAESNFITVEKLNSYIPDTVPFKFTYLSNKQEGSNHRQDVYIWCKYPASLKETITLEVSNFNVSISYFKPIDKPCNDYTFS